eukprot:TRINITY_DN22011_c0_g1_i1.p1 TRINITY_DN22011_c0_g1~~TRINITY_DN22011_c0_g1_i1.p1  ORF type:complete len:273 (+),score=50.38 TRINITY_DN22011_c0_g1_i1:88-906(+)
MSADCQALRRCRPFLQRAGELDAHEPIPAHYCRLFAVESLVKAMQRGELDAAAQGVMMEEFAKAEASKARLDLSQGQETMEAFALRVFDNVDLGDRNGSTTAATAAQFYAAACFLDVCAQFYSGELPPDLAEKSKYAKYRTVQIRDCIKQGLNPAPSPPATSAAPAGASFSAPSSAAAAAPVAPAALSAGYTPVPAPVAPTPVVTPMVTVPAGNMAGAGRAGGVVPAASCSAAGKSEAKKKCEFAASALDFDDAATAKRLILEALQILESGR